MGTGKFRFDTGSLSRPVLVVLLLLVIIGAAVRLHNIDRKCCWHDEALTLQVLSGFTVGEIYRREFTGKIVSPADLQIYQGRNPEKGLSDTVRALISGNPLHAPVYYVSAWVVDGTALPPLEAARCTSAAFGTMAVAAIAWLCLEMFGAQSILIAVLLFALSPFLVTYSQEAREYAAWTLALALSAAAFLRALKTDTTRSWLVYAGLTAFAVNSHILTVALIAGQVVVACVLERRLWSQKIAHLGAAILGVAVTSVPWFFASFFSMTNPKLLGTPTRVTLESNLGDIGSISIGNMLCIFFDAPFTLAEPLCLVAVFVLLVEVGSLVYFARKADRYEKTVVLGFALPVACLLLALDIMLGGARASGARYMTPALIGLALPVVYTAQSLMRAGGKKFILAGVLMLSLVSCELTAIKIGAESRSWWSKLVGGADVALIADAVNATESPLVVTESDFPNLGQALALSHYLKPQARLLLVPKDEAPPVPPAYTNVFVLSLSREYVKHFANTNNTSMTRFPNLHGLWLAGQ